MINKNSDWDMRNSRPVRKLRQTNQPTDRPTMTDGRTEGQNETAAVRELQKETLRSSHRSKTVWLAFLLCWLSRREKRFLHAISIADHFPLTMLSVPMSFLLLILTLQAVAWFTSAFMSLWPCLLLSIIPMTQISNQQSCHRDYEENTELI